jgi:uncharacterized RDD family membrane protein YckC
MTDYGAQNPPGWQQQPGANYQNAFSDPYAEAALYRGVLSRRVMAFLIDAIVISLPILLVTIVIAVLGVVTLGIGWSLFWLLSPASAIWAVIYYGASLGGPHSATPGMRMFGIQLRTVNGAQGTFLLGAAHALLFWLSVSFLTPFVLLIALFNRRRRLVQDLILGTVIVNREDRW